MTDALDKLESQAKALFPPACVLDGLTVILMVDALRAATEIMDDQRSAQELGAALGLDWATKKEMRINAFDSAMAALDAAVTHQQAADESANQLRELQQLYAAFEGSGHNPKNPREAAQAIRQMADSESDVADLRNELDMERQRSFGSDMALRARLAVAEREAAEQIRELQHQLDLHKRALAHEQTELAECERRERLRAEMEPRHE